MKVGFQHPKDGDIGLYRVLNTHAHSRRRTDKNICTRASLNRSRDTQNRNCQRCILNLFVHIKERLCAFTFLAPPGQEPGLRFGLGFCMTCFQPRLPSALSQASTLFVVSNSIRSTFHGRGFQIHPASQHLAVPEVWDHPHFLTTGAQASSTSSSASRLRLWTCIRSCLQDHAPFALKSLPETHMCKVLLSSHEQQCQNTLHCRLPHHLYFLKFPPVT